MASMRSILRRAHAVMSAWKFSVVSQHQQSSKEAKRLHVKIIVEPVVEGVLPSNLKGWGKLFKWVIIALDAVLGEIIPLYSALALAVKYIWKKFLKLFISHMYNLRNDISFPPVMGIISSNKGEIWIRMEAPDEVEDPRMKTFSLPKDVFILESNGPELGFYRKVVVMPVGAKANLTKAAFKAEVQNGILNVWIVVKNDEEEKKMNKEDEDENEKERR
ncbi:hypothetical protein QVD17_38881 [Tagetes erecta]|uniref:Uncharacterized protein n=1 Tax=Tagetes erecta TaxID=13708 RepID=A0AAD8NFR4_TARER|nr:hypothetical protein QVD17_38881 [Tagetes erecta]